MSISAVQYKLIKSYSLKQKLKFFFYHKVCYLLITYYITFQFVTTKQKKAEGGKREAEVFIHRKRGDLTIPYKVVENINKFVTNFQKKKMLQWSVNQICFNRKLSARN